MRTKFIMKSVLANDDKNTKKAPVLTHHHNYHNI